MGTAHHLHVVHPRGVALRPVPPLVLPLLPVPPMEPPLRGLIPSAPAPVPAHEQASQITEAASTRCREKGCIFPAVGGVDEKCVHHCREEREPAMYLSRQPTRAALDQGKFLQADEEALFGSRGADRRRFEAERQAFFES